MIQEYFLLKNKNYEMVLQFDDEDFDYYTNVNVKIRFADTEYLLYDDNLLELRNVVLSFSDNIRLLDKSLNESKIGLLLNNYYFELDEAQTSYKIVLDDNESWIGEKYHYLMSNDYATWLYTYRGNIILKVTPVFHSDNEEIDCIEYNRFLESYKDIFRDEISLEQLIAMKNVVVSTYNKYMR